MRVRACVRASPYSEPRPRAGMRGVAWRRAWRRSAVIGRAGPGPPFILPATVGSDCLYTLPLQCSASSPEHARTIVSQGQSRMQHGALAGILCHRTCVHARKRDSSERSVFATRTLYISTATSAQDRALQRSTCNVELARAARRAGEGAEAASYRGQAWEKTKAPRLPCRARGTAADAEGVLASRGHPPHAGHDWGPNPLASLGQGMLLLRKLA